MADDALALAAELASYSTAHLASSLYARAAGHPDGLAGIAAELGLTLPQLYRLALCRRPVTQDELDLIAATFGIPPAVLARVAFE